MPESIRPAVTAIRETLKRKETALADSYARRPLTRNYLAGRTALVDQTIVALWQTCGLDDRCALIATGGYGRGELFPFSDIDLLILLPDAVDSQTEAALTRFVGALWDIGLHIGHSVRTVDECLAVAAEDITIQTNLLEMRQLLGPKDLFETLIQGASFEF
jgi:[protein-PII] uridylyltransferase